MQRWGCSRLSSMRWVSDPSWWTVAVGNEVWLDSHHCVGTLCVLSPTRNTFVAFNEKRNKWLSKLRFAPGNCEHRLSMGCGLLPPVDDKLRSLLRMTNNRKQNITPSAISPGTGPDQTIHIRSMTVVMSHGLGPKEKLANRVLRRSSAASAYPSVEGLAGSTGHRSA